MRRIAVATALVAVAAACGSPAGESPRDEGNDPRDEGNDAGAALRVPQHGPVPEPPEVEDDPPTDAKIELGNYIYFDRRLSGSGHSNCDGCHLHETSFQDSLRTSVPDRSYPSDTPATERNTTSFLNIVHAPVSRWDGSGTDLLDVLVLPYAEANMNLGKDVPSAQIELQRRLTVVAPGYVPLFHDAFGEDIRAATPEDVWRLTARALRAFVRKAESRDSAFDRWNAGDDEGMSESAQRGLALFDGKAKCALCHGGPFFTDFGFHNISTSPPDEAGARRDEGRYLVTGDEDDRGKFLTPTLRSVFQTGPYFHDGSAYTLQQVIRHKASEAVTRDPDRDALFREPLDLTDDEIGDLVQFLAALRGVDVRSAFTEPPPNTP